MRRSELRPSHPWVALARLRAVLLGVVVFGAGSVRADVRTFQDLKAQLVGDDSDRRASLEAFAADERPALKDRVAAAAMLGKDKGATVEERLAAFLLEARLCGLDGKLEKKRQKALQKALGLAKKADKKQAALIAHGVTGDRALVRIEKAAKKARPPPRGKTRGKQGKKQGKPRSRGMGLDDERKAVKSAQPAWKRLGDEPRVVRASLALLLLDEAGGESPKRIAARAEKLLAALDDTRDLAPIRADLHRLRSRAAEALGQAQEAAVQSLAADHATTAPLKAAAFDEVGPDQGYFRSKRSADLCQAIREKGIRCEQLEEERWGKRTFYDFSRGRKSPRFSQSKAAAVLAEFDGLLKDCIEISEQLTSLDSQVELSWTVEPTGRVGKHEIRPRFLASGAFARCAEEAFARFRYPPFRGPPAEVGYRIDIGS